MDSGGIAGKAGIWRASWRKSVVEHILRCSEDEAHACAEQLAQWCGCAAHLEQECQRVADEVRCALNGHGALDDRLRVAIMESVISAIKNDNSSRPQLVLAATG